MLYNVIIEVKNIPGMLPESSTRMIASNIYNLVRYLSQNASIKLDMSDEIVSGILTTFDGSVVHKGALEAMGVPA